MGPNDLDPVALLQVDGRLRALARALVHDPVEAEDLAQEVWLAKLEAHPVRNLRGWLATVARRLALDRRRGASQRRDRVEVGARPEAIPGAAEILEREDARRRVIEALLALDEPLRSTLVLRFLEELPPRAVAARMGVPVETVRSRTRTGLGELRARLDRAFGSRGAWAALLIPFARLPLVPTAEGASSPSPSTSSSIQRKATMQTSLKLAAAGLALVGGAAYWLSPAHDSRASSADLAQSNASLAAPSEGSEAQHPEAALVAPKREALSASATLSGKAFTPTPPSVERVSTSSLHLTVTWSDGTPAAGIHANVQDIGRSEQDSLTGLTDAEGQCTIAGLRAGRCWVTLDRKEDWDRATLVAGETTELALQLESGFDVEGVVVDENQMPVAGATVWCGELGRGPAMSFPLTTSAADGSFSLRACKRLDSIWARADEHAPSLQRMLLDSDVSPVSVTLALRGAGARVTGRVTDANGAPVDGALVLVDGQSMQRSYRETLPDGRRISRSHAGPVGLRTDSDGRFALTGVTPGTVPLGVLAHGLAAWRGSLEIAAGETGDTQITLTDGFRVSGTIRDAAGNPVAGRVFAYCAALSSQLSPTVMTGPDGGYEFEALAPGEIHVVVDGQTGEAHTILSGQAGDDLAWDAVLGAELSSEERPFETAPWGR